MIRRAGVVLVLAVVVAGLASRHWNTQIADWWQLRSYHAPTAIAGLAAADEMTGTARHLFYLNTPQLVSDASLFRTDCPGREQTIVLGCYQGGENGIYIYAVSDPRLDGVLQVTAAHEMLHAAYERLSDGDRKHVDAMLLDYYRTGLHDPRVIKSMAAYKGISPTNLVNEMHSVFGTEVANLPPALEAYYSKYFEKRSVVTAFAARYDEQFESRIRQIRADEVELRQQALALTRFRGELHGRRALITHDRARLDRLREGHQIAVYNAGIGAYNNEIDAYNTVAEELHRAVASYNQLVAAHNALVSTLAGLNEAIDTRVEPGAR